MNNKIIGITATVGILGLALGFFGGMTYAKNTAGPAVPRGNFATMTEEERRALRGQFGGGQNGAPRFSRQNGASGEIVSRAEESIVIKLDSGGSQNIYYSSSTGILNTASATPAELLPGKKIMVNGTPNTDGSISANVITVRP